MKILHIIPSYLPGQFAGGPINPVHFLNRELVKRGIKVTVFTTDRDGPRQMKVPLNQEVDIDGVKVFYFENSLFKSWYYSMDMHRALIRRVNEFNIIHITSVFLFASTLGAYYARKFKKPYVISPHGSLMLGPLSMKSPFKKSVYIKLIERRNLINAAAIHFTVEVEKEEYLKSKLPLKKSLIIPNMFDPKEFKGGQKGNSFREKFKIPLDKEIILFLGRINWKKGLDTLIPAFKEVTIKKSNVILVIAGMDDDGYRQIVEKMVLENELVDKVVFTGMLLGGDRESAIRCSKVFVLPSYSENFGMAVVEAMSLGLPVIISKEVGLSLEVKRFGAGLVIEKNKTELAGAILKILEDKKVADSLIERGKKLVEMEFIPSVVVDRFVKYYIELTN